MRPEPVLEINEIGKSLARLIRERKEREMRHKLPI